MVQLTLPKNSTVKKGKTWNKPTSGGTFKEFQIYRWSPDDEEKPHWRRIRRTLAIAVVTDMATGSKDN